MKLKKFIPIIITSISLLSCRTRTSIGAIKANDATSGGIQEVDAIFSTLGATDLESFKEFLKDEQKKTVYFDALYKYFNGGCFARKNFDAIIDQFKDFSEVADTPEKKLFFERFFAPSTGTEYGLISDVTSYNRNLDEAKLMQYLQNEFLPKLKFETREFQLVRSEESGNALATKLVKNLSEELASLEAKVDVTLNKKKQREEFGRITGAFTKGANKATIQDIARWFLLSELRNNSGIFIRRNPDIVLAAFGTLPADAGRRRATIAGDLKGLQTAIDKMIPTVKELLTREDIFPKVTIVNEFGVEQTRKVRASSTVNFVPVPRLIHSAFKGIPGGECVNGGNSYAEQKYATPARWATAFLSGSMMHYAEDGGKYVGFAEWIPLKYVADEKPNYKDKVFATMSLGGSFLTGTTTVTVGDNSSQVPTWKLWLDSAAKQYPRDWVGVARSDGSSADHVYLGGYLQQDPIWREGEQLGGPQNFNHTDGMGQYLSKVLPWTPQNPCYGPDLICNMVTDVTIWWGNPSAPRAVVLLNLEKNKIPTSENTSQQQQNPLIFQCKPIDWNGFLSATAEQLNSKEFQEEFSKCLGSQPWFKTLKDGSKTAGEYNANSANAYIAGERALQGYYAAVMRSSAEIRDPTLIGQLLFFANSTLTVVQSLKPQVGNFRTNWQQGLPLLDVITFRMAGYEEARKTILENYLKGVKTVLDSDTSNATVQKSVAEALARGTENQVSTYIKGLLEVVDPIPQ